MAKGTKGYGASQRKAAAAVPRSKSKTAPSSGGIGGAPSTNPVAVGGSAKPVGQPAGAPTAVASAVKAAAPHSTAGQGFGGGASAATATAKKPAASYDGLDAGAKVVEKKDLWKAEFNDHKKAEIHVQDGSVIVVGNKYKDVDSQVSLGKDLPFSTGGYYFGGGLAGFAKGDVAPDKPVVYAVMSSGEVACYDYEKGIAGGKPPAAGGKGDHSMTQAQAAAVMYGDYHKAKQGPQSDLDSQFIAAYATHVGEPSKTSLLKAADAHYAWAKAQEGSPAFGSKELAAEAKAYAKKHDTKKQAQTKTHSGPTLAVVGQAKTAGAVQTSPPTPALPKTDKAYDPDKYGGHFDSLNEVNEWAGEAYGGWKKSLTSDESYSLASYKSTGYQALNRELRTGKGQLSGHHKEMSKNMDSAFEKAPPLQEPMVVYRGRLPDAVCKAFSGGEESGLVGRVFGDAGYLSTSFNRKVGKNFASSNKHGASVGRLTIPKGSKPIYLESINHMGESEMLLPRDSKIMVTNAYKKDGQTWVDAVVLP